METTPHKAIDLVRQYNRETQQIDALETRLYRMREKHRATHDKAFRALPEGYAISLGGDEPWFVVDPQGKRI